MPLVVLGLGNPGEEYQNHRHNIGFRIVDRLGALHAIRLKPVGFINRFEFGAGSISGRRIVLVKPLTYMNRSGEILKTVLKQARAGLDDLLVVFDSLDLEIGKLKLKLKGSSGGHRGLESILAAAKTQDVTRLAVGIGRPPGKKAVVDYVLGEPGRAEQKLLDETCDQAIGAILRMLKEPRQRVMGDVNRRSKNDDQTANSALS